MNTRWYLALRASLPGGGRGQRIVLAVLALSVAVLLGAWGWTQLQINKEDSALTQQEAMQSYLHAVSWLKANESSVLTQGNSALWWMIDTAARRSGDPYLNELVERHLRFVYQGLLTNSPWMRLVRPRSPVREDAQPEEGLERYQRFFLAAATCRPDDDTRPFLMGHVCRPALTKVWLSDRVCSTHHLMGLMIHHRNGCKATPDAARLQGELLDDIEAQARLDPFMRDAALQRVLMLAWVGGAERPQSSWVRRVQQAQQADGGWSGETSLPEWPHFIQPHFIRTMGARLTGRPWRRSAPPSDFHASAQGLLLMALLAHPTGKSGWQGE